MHSRGDYSTSRLFTDIISLGFCSDLKSVVTETTFLSNPIIIVAGVNEASHSQRNLSVLFYLKRRFLFNWHKGRLIFHKGFESPFAAFHFPLTEMAHNLNVLNLITLENDTFKCVFNVPPFNYCGLVITRDTLYRGWESQHTFFARPT